MYSYTPTRNLWEDELQMPQITFINKQQQWLENRTRQWANDQTPMATTKEEHIETNCELKKFHNHTHINLPCKLDLQRKTIHCLCIDVDLHKIITLCISKAQMLPMVCTSWI
jgi:hypothetical protein